MSDRTRDVKSPEPLSSPPSGGGSNSGSVRKRPLKVQPIETDSRRKNDKPDEKSEVKDGLTDKGETFQVPPTLNTVQALADPRNWNLFTLVTLSVAAVNVYLTFFGNLSVVTHICIFLFWRFCYNVGLGVILQFQSTRKSVTRWYERWVSKPSSLMGRFVLYLASSHLPKGKTSKDFPTAFNAWIVYRQLVDLVLLNDSLNYILLGVKCFEPPSTVGWLEMLQYAVGIFLGAFNYWAKVDAHRCIGDYCWYWGDFFFRKDQNLTFDGIFELFPHPMYTVGYSLYYGYSLICRSYTMLFVSLLAHMLQLAFLVVVEEPHIERTYGSSSTELDPRQYRVLYDPKEGFFSMKHSSVFMVYLTYFRFGDLALLSLCIYGVIVSFALSVEVAVAQVVFWRAVHWVGLGYVLWAQSRRGMWTRHYLERGRTLYEAFDNWKRLYNLSLTMNVLVFVGCAMRFWPVDAPFTMSHRDLACVALGMLLIALNFWSSVSIYKIVGDFGWFYGDFFIPPERYKQNLVYTGIYRFLNNPDCVTGYAGLYGLALMVQSWTVFFLALMSQVMNILFLNLVEIPHMKKLYARNMRNDGPLSRQLSARLKDLLPVQDDELEDKLRHRARKIRMKAMKDIYTLYKKMEEVKDKVTGATTPTRINDVRQTPRVRITAPDELILGSELQVGFETDPNHADTDWIGIYEVQVPSMPGQSNGKWCYVPPGGRGSVQFHLDVLPRSAGVYELRYHLANTYKVVATKAIRITDVDEDEVLDNSPMSPSPKE